MSSVRKCNQYSLSNVRIFSAQRLLSFYQWSKELLTRLNVKFWNEIKTVLGQVIREKLGRIKSGTHY